MKKWWLLFTAFAALTVVWFLFFKTYKSKYFIAKNIEVNSKAFSKHFVESKNWQKWWPGTMATSDKWNFEGLSFSIAEKRFSSLIINIEDGKSFYKSELLYVPIKSDSIKLIWQGADSINKSGFMQLLSNKKSSNTLDSILQKIKQYYSNEDHIYDLHIEQSHVIDETLISTDAISKGYPSVNFIYGLVEILNTYAAKSGAKVTNHPMLNISTSDSVQYKVQVALPLDKKLSDSGNIHYKWMLPGGNILAAEVKGGSDIINRGFDAINKYMQDHGRVAPAIHFQSLITDRRQQKDSTQWFTKLYWPVM